MKRHNPLIVIHIVVVLMLLMSATACHKDTQPEPMQLTVEEDSLVPYRTEADFAWTVDFPGKVSSVVRLSPNADMSDAQTFGSDTPTGDKSFTARATGLNAHTTYYYCYEAWNPGVSFTSEVKSFMTKDLPTVTTGEVTDITPTTATCSGDVTDDGGAAVTERGVCWSATEEEPTVGDSHAASGTGTGSFTVELTGLEPGTTYHVRAYATNIAGTSYGMVKTLTTEATIPRVMTVEVTDVTRTTATVVGEVEEECGAEVTERGVCWSTSPSPTTGDDHASNGAGVGPFTVTLSGLEVGETYYVRAYARNSVGTAYGEELDFVTGEAVKPTVLTSEITNIEWGMATGGGEVTDDGGAAVTERGVCWSTSQNPTLSDSHASSGTGTGSFTSNLTGLSSNTTYYVRAYATNSVGTGYGTERSFTTIPWPNGELPGQFSVSATQQVYFSQGNLQYNASSNTWRFATKQWDYVGDANSNSSSTYSGWIDLFGWGTSGYNHGAVCYQPWSTSQTYSDYYAYGQYTYNLYDQTGKADWGYNPISNGGNQENRWRTLTTEEWVYVFNTRSTVSGIRFAKAQVNNVNGVILLPDDWSSSTYPLSNTNTSDASFSSNTITSDQWATLEQAGAVFLPAAGNRNGTSVGGAGSLGLYWSASFNDSSYAYYVLFYDSYLHPQYYGYFRSRSYGFSVRLARVAE